MSRTMVYLVCFVDMRVMMEQHREDEKLFCNVRTRVYLFYSLNLVFVRLHHALLPTFLVVHLYTPGH
jgi:hypothetical protein